MTSWIGRFQAVYRLAARAFPHEFRMVCGDGLERLGEDVAPVVWREHGVLGLVALFADIAVRLPVEYVSMWLDKLKETTMPGDLFEGTWKASVEKSQFDPRFKPEQACLRFEATGEGYLFFAYGVKDGQAVAERPQSIIADGKRRPVVDLNGRPIPGMPPGAMAVGNRPDPYTLQGGVEVDGKPLIGGTYRVSEDGKTLTVTAEGMSIKGPFKQVAVFERVDPDPYVPR